MFLLAFLIEMRSAELNLLSRIILEKKHEDKL